MLNHSKINFHNDIRYLPTIHFFFSNKNKKKHKIYIDILPFKHIEFAPKDAVCAFKKLNKVNQYRFFRENMMT